MGISELCAILGMTVEEYHDYRVWLRHHNRRN